MDVIVFQLTTSVEAMILDSDNPCILLGRFMCREIARKLKEREKKMTYPLTRWSEHLSIQTKRKLQEEDARIQLTTLKRRRREESDSAEKSCEPEVQIIELNREKLVQNSNVREKQFAKDESNEKVTDREKQIANDAEKEKMTFNVNSIAKDAKCARVTVRKNPKMLSDAANASEIAKNEKNGDKIDVIEKLFDARINRIASEKSLYKKVKSANLTVNAEKDSARDNLKVIGERVAKSAGSAESANVTNSRLEMFEPQICSTPFKLCDAKDYFRDNKLKKGGKCVRANYTYKKDFMRHLRLETVKCKKIHTEEDVNSSIETIKINSREDSKENLQSSKDKDNSVKNDLNLCLINKLVENFSNWIEKINNTNKFDNFEESNENTLYNLVNLKFNENRVKSLSNLTELSHYFEKLKEINLSNDRKLDSARLSLESKLEIRHKNIISTNKRYPEFSFRNKSVTVNNINDKHVKFDRASNFCKTYIKFVKSKPRSLMELGKFLDSMSTNEKSGLESCRERGKGR